MNLFHVLIPHDSTPYTQLHTIPHFIPPSIPQGETLLPRFRFLFHVHVFFFHQNTLLISYLIPRSHKFIPRKQVLFHKKRNYVDSVQFHGVSKSQLWADSASTRKIHIVPKAHILPQATCSMPARRLLLYLKSLIA